MSEWLTGLDLQDIILFCQDWGGLIGLRLVASFPERFAGVVASNTGLPAGVIPAEFVEPLREAYKTLPVVKVTELDEKFRDESGVPGFLYWRKFCAESPEFDVGQAVQLTAKGDMSEAVAAGYRAPFPDQSYMAGARKFPSLVPLLPDEDEVQENLEAWKVLGQFNKPFITAFADDDPASTGGEASFLDSVPGADGAPHRTIENAGHFVQQDQPQACVQAILDLAALVVNPRE
jgi:haloalkane dehalogenase